MNIYAANLAAAERRKRNAARSAILRENEANRLAQYEVNARRARLPLAELLFSAGLFWAAAGIFLALVR
jgi:hypothetical protein